MSYSANRNPLSVRQSAKASLSESMFEEGVEIERGMLLTGRNYFVQENAETVYASALCLSMGQLFPTWEEAKAEADTYGGVNTCGDHWEYGYVLELAPGDLEYTEHGLIYDQFNAFNKPNWLELRSKDVAMLPSMRKKDFSNKATRRFW
jgi:hypothetical protein